MNIEEQKRRVNGEFWEASVGAQTVSHSSGRHSQNSRHRRLSDELPRRMCQFLH